jgi:signal transduction histidine kinase
MPACERRDEDRRRPQARVKKTKKGRIPIAVPPFSLRGALTLLVLIAIAPVFAVVFQSSLAEQAARLERSEATLRSVVELAAAHQERLVEGARQMLAAIAHSPPAYGDDTQVCANYMRKLQLQYPVAYGTFGMLDAQGRLTCRSEPPPVAVVSRDRLFYRAAVDTGRFSVGEFVISRASGKPVLAFGMPVYRDEGRELRGVAYVALDLGRADEHLRKLPLLSEMSLLVTDASGVVLSAAGAQAVNVGTRLPPGLLRDAVAGGQRRFDRAIGADGLEWLFNVEPVGRSGEAKLFVVGSVSTAAVIAPLTERLRMQMAALGLITVVGAFAAWLFGERVVARPVARLLERIDELQREQVRLDVPVAAGGPRELREMERRFQEMARTLAERSVQRDGAMAEMKAQRNLLESVLGSMAEGVLVIGVSGHFLHANAAALAILPGLSELNRQRAPMLALGQEWGLYELDGGTPVAPQSRPSARALGGETIENFRYLIRGRLSGGVEKIIQGNARALSSFDGDRYGAVLVFSDISESYRAEQALKQMNDTLERRVGERTRELAVSNRELESFSYSVSHDLRAPLQAIDGFGRALLSRHAQHLDQQARHYLDRIRDNTRQMGDLIDDLLSLARVTRTEIYAEPLNLAAKAGEIVEGLRQRYPTRQVDVQIDPEIVCSGDARLLGIALENLLENAWKFTGRTASARIHVGHKTGDQGEDVVFVADNGAGFDMAYVDKLFNAFQRLHAAHEFEGTGIGLATVQRIVARHGGRVWAESRPGQGAIFQFTLKVGANDEKRPHPAGRGQPGSSGTHADDPLGQSCSQ